MRQVEQVLHDHQRIGAALVEALDLLQRAFGIALQHRLEQVEDEATIGDAEHVTHRRLFDPAGRQRDRLVEQGQPVAHRAVGRARDEAQRRRCDLDRLRRGDLPVMRDQLFDGHAPQ